MIKDIKMFEIITCIVIITLIITKLLFDYLTMFFLFEGKEDRQVTKKKYFKRKPIMKSRLSEFFKNCHQRLIRISLEQLVKGVFVFFCCKKSKSYQCKLTKFFFFPPKLKTNIRYGWPSCSLFRLILIQYTLLTPEKFVLTEKSLAVILGWNNIQF